MAVLAFNFILKVWALAEAETHRRPSPRHRRLSLAPALQSMKCHSIDHLLALTFLYGKARQRCPRGLSLTRPPGSDSRRDVQTILLALTYIASPITFMVALLEVACAYFTPHTPPGKRSHLHPSSFAQL